MENSSIIIISIIAFLILSILPYSLAEKRYNYNIYNIKNLGIIFGGMVALFIVLVISGQMEKFELTLTLFGIIIFLTSLIVFIRTLKATNLLIAILGIIPQILITIIIYLIAKMIYNRIYKSE